MNTLFPVFEAFLDDETIGIFHISLVEQPAIEVDFEAHQTNVDFTHYFSDYKYITGPLLIPEQLLLRKGEGGYFYLKYSEATIKMMRDKLFESNLQNEINLEHSDDLKVKATLVQSQIADEEHKGLPKGTLQVTLKPKFKITDDFLSKFKGFSIGAKIKLKNTNMNINQEVVFAKFKDGTAVVQDDETMEIWYEADMTKVPTGTYELEDGTTLKVEDGFIMKEQMGETDSKDTMSKEIASMQSKLETLSLKVAEFDNLFNTLNKELETKQSKVEELEVKVVQMKVELVKQSETLKIIGAEPSKPEEVVVNKPHKIYEVAHNKMMDIIEKRNKKNNN